ALDLGTTFIKGAVLDLDNLRLHHISRLPFPEPLPNLPPLFHEVDPGKVVTMVRALIADLLTHVPDCEGIVICTQMHGLMLCQPDAPSLHTIITWHHRRVPPPHLPAPASFFDKLPLFPNAGDPQQLGNEYHPSRPLCYLYWMAKNGKLPETTAIPA